MKTYQELKNILSKANAALLDARVTAEQAKVELDKCESIICPDGISVNINDGWIYTTDARYSVSDLRYIVLQAKRRGLIESENVPPERINCDSDTPSKPTPNAWVIEMIKENGEKRYYDPSDPYKPWVVYTYAITNVYPKNQLADARKIFSEFDVNIVPCRIEMAPYPGYKARTADKE